MKSIIFLFSIFLSFLSIFLSSFIDQDSFITKYRAKQLRESLLNGLAAIRQNDYASAHYYFDLILSTNPTHSDALYNKGVAYHYDGDAIRAIEAFTLALQSNPKDLRIRLNLAAVYHLKNSLNEAIEHYKSGLETAIISKDELWSKFQLNLGSAYYQAGNIIKSFETFHALLLNLQRYLPQICGHSSNVTSDEERSSYCLELQSSFDHGLNNLLNVRRSVVFLQEQEYQLQYLLYRTIKGTLSSQELIGYPNKSILRAYSGLIDSSVPLGKGPLLPFDTLQYEIPLSLRYVIASANALTLLSKASNSNPEPIPSPPSFDPQKSLRIGFISHDFNDHPTAHLLEGILTKIHDFRHKVSSLGSSSHPSSRLSIHVTLFSYGPNDNSIYRKNLQQDSDQFIDLIYVSDVDAFKIIQQQDLDILLDLQLYTLGHRFEIVARQPVPLQVNYLVYPGTSGGNFLQYLVADQIVVPPEHSQHYSESLVLMPGTYQVSYYGRYDLEESSRQGFQQQQAATNHNPHNNQPLVLVNFNKLDKFDFDSLQIWTQIMNRFPNSIMWLLKPTKPFETNTQNNFTQSSLLSQFQLRGIPSSRISLAPRCNKEDHIRRHKDGHLFLDTMIYGAHSTATDALKGGLPVITLHGNAFPNRVASSLLSSFNSSHNSNFYSSFLSKLLITYSKKSYEDLVIRLLRSPSLLSQLREMLTAESCVSVSNMRKSVKKLGIFDTDQHVHDFISAVSVMREVQYLKRKREENVTKKGKYPHLIITRSS